MIVGICGGYGLRMHKSVVFIVGIISAVFAAIILHVFMADVLDLSQSRLSSIPWRPLEY